MDQNNNNSSTAIKIPNTQKSHAHMAGSPSMSSSYENQWLNTSGGRRKSTSNSDAFNASGPTKDSTSPRKPQKETTKAERRAAQEQQRAEKQKRLEAGQAKTSKRPHENKQTSQQQRPQQKTSTATPTNTTQPPAPTDITKKNQVPWLLHLEPQRKPDTTGTDKHLHPAILSLGLYFSEFKIVGSNARCIAMLEAFTKLIEDHKPPHDASFARNLQKHLVDHIAFLLHTRPLSLSIRECVRWLKKEITCIVEENPPLTDEESRSRLKDRIQHFIEDRITCADEVIVNNCLQKIQDGDVILTYSKSSIVEHVLLAAKRKGIRFKVIIVDSRPLFEGKHLLKRLVTSDIDCSYYLISSAYVALKSVTKVIMGAHALLSNGAVYSRVGSAMVAMAARDYQIPVMICCETYKFVDRAQVDSSVLNEIGDPDDLVSTKRYISGGMSSQSSVTDKPALASWREQPNLRPLNLLYDVTPAEYITVVVTEVGLIPNTSAPVICREYNNQVGVLG